MTNDQIHRIALQAGLNVQKQRIGFRLTDAAGGVVASQLPKDHIEALVKAALNARVLQNRVLAASALLY